MDKGGIAGKITDEYKIPIKVLVNIDVIDGEVIIKRKDGSLYKIKPILQNESPLDVKGIDLKLSQNEIVNIIRDVRER